MAIANATTQPPPPQPKPRPSIKTALSAGGEKGKGILSRRPIASLWLDEISTALDTATLLPMQWVLHLPLSQKYLMVAAFLASHNPKESDASIFAGNSRGKKRKVPTLS